MIINSKSGIYEMSASKVDKYLRIGRLIPFVDIHGFTEQRMYLEEQMIVDCFNMDNDLYLVLKNMNTSLSDEYSLLEIKTVNNVVQPTRIAVISDDDAKQISKKQTNMRLEVIK